MEGYEQQHIAKGKFKFGLKHQDAPNHILSG